MIATEKVPKNGDKSADRFIKYDRTEYGRLNPTENEIRPIFGVQCDSGISIKHMI